jgi:hypothetical protein
LKNKTTTVHLGNQEGKTVEVPFKDRLLVSSSWNHTGGASRTGLVQAVQMVLQGALPPSLLPRIGKAWVEEQMGSWEAGLQDKLVHFFFECFLTGNFDPASCNVVMISSQGTE